MCSDANPTGGSGGWRKRCSAQLLDDLSATNAALIEFQRSLHDRRTLTISALPERSVTP
jgi:hypothetical protein